MPTNAVLYYEIPAYTVNPPGDYTLHTESGEQVALTVKLAVAPYVELTSAGGLQPNTRYRLDAKWDTQNGMVSETWLNFETGAGPITQPPAAPRAVLHTYQLAPIGSTCGPMLNGTCLSVADDNAYIELTPIDALGQAHSPWLIRGSTVFSPLTGAGTSARCIELRERAADGTRSEPLRLCGADRVDADLTMLDADPQLVCTARGLEWCDTSGRSGIAPGVDVPATAKSDLSCGPDLTAQKIHALGAAGGAPLANDERNAAESGCSTLPGRSRNVPGVATFAMLGYLLVRRKRR